MSTVLCNKYSEGYPGRRYYQGNEHIDAIETLAIERAKKLFGADHANVQPLSGSPANFAVFLALLKPGDVILGMDLSAGGHLTHGSPVNFSGRIYKAYSYGVDSNGIIDYDEVERIARTVKPKLIISGHSAYSRVLDFERFGKIASSVGAYHLADISHISGLVAAKAHPSPVPHADVVTFTTHKTLRGPRGAIILCKQEHAKAIDKAVFPGSQGGAHNNQIAAKAVALHEAAQKEFADYIQQVLLNAKTLAETLDQRGLRVVSGGTDNHLMLLDVVDTHGPGMGGPLALALEEVGIVCNKNTVPNDPSTPFKPSGIRIGTPWPTTNGLDENDMRVLGKIIADVLDNPTDEGVKTICRRRVEALCSR